MAKSKEVTKKEDQLPANIDMEADADSGFEGADAESFAIPFIRVLQKLSPQVDEDSEERIDEAKAGMLFETVGKTLIAAKLADKEPGLEVIPCHYERSFLEWAPRNSGGGLNGKYTVAEAEPMLATCSKDENNKPVLPNGNQLSDTRTFYVLAKINDEWQPVVISMSSSQVKKAKAWMSLMHNLKAVREDKTKYTPPMFSSIYRLNTVKEQKDDNTWYGWNVERACYCGDTQVYQLAKQFREQIAKGVVEVKHEQGAEAYTEPGDM